MGALNSVGNAAAFLFRQKPGCNVSPCSYCLGLEMWFPQHQGGKQQQRKHKLICSTSWANYLFLSSFPFLSVWCGGNTKIFLFVSKRLHSAQISLDIHFEAHSVCNHDASVLGEQFLCCFESGVRSQLGWIRWGMGRGSKLKQRGRVLIQLWFFSLPLLCSIWIHLLHHLSKEQETDCWGLVKPTWTGSLLHSHPLPLFALRHFADSPPIRATQPPF